MVKTGEVPVRPIQGSAVAPCGSEPRESVGESREVPPPDPRQAVAVAVKAPDPQAAALDQQRRAAGVAFGDAVDAMPKPFGAVASALWQFIGAETQEAVARGEKPMEPTFRLACEVRKLALAACTAEDQARSAEARGETADRPALLRQELINQIEAATLSQHVTLEQIQACGARANQQAEALAAAGHGGSAAGLMNDALKALLTPAQLEAMKPEVHSQPLAQVLLANRDLAQFLAPSMAEGFESAAGCIHAAGAYHQAFLAAMAHQAG